MSCPWQLFCAEEVTEIKCTWNTRYLDALIYLNYVPSVISKGNIDTLFT